MFNDHLKYNYENGKIKLKSAMKCKDVNGKYFSKESLYVLY